MTGVYEHSIDAKGRVFVPVRLREALGEGFYVCKGLENSLFVYSAQSWEKLEIKISEMPIVEAREMQLQLFPTAMRGEPDNQGRILLSPKLREYAGFTKNVVFAGVGGHAEIWDAERWKIREAKMTSEMLEKTMKLLNV